MTFTARKLHLAIAVLAVALIGPATAWAAGVFDDVPDGRFFTEAAEWAAAEGITTGVSTNPPLFAPDDPVTRGQNVTFLKRYHDNLVQPALDDTYTRAEIDAAVAQVSAGPVGPEGPAGPAGPAGSMGPRGLSAWDPIPSGTTVSGHIRWDEESSVTSGDYGLYIPFGAVAPVGLTSANWAPDADSATIDDDATCTGSLVFPTAPPGQVCMYLGNRSNNVADLEGRVLAIFLDTGFEVWWRPTGTGDMYVNGTWAYTAP